MATNLPRKLNPDTGEWEVDQPAAPAAPTGTTGTQSASGGAAPLPAPPVYNAPQVAGSNMYNPNGDFVAGGPNPATYAANVAASGTQTATPTTAPVPLPANLSADMTDAQVGEWTANYLSSHGGDPTKVPYWIGKWNLWGKKDPNYYLQKLANDESITHDSSPSVSSLGQLITAPMPSSFSAPSSSAPAAPEPLMNISQDPFASMGGGVHLANGAWVPKGHPLADGPLWQDAPAPAAPTAAVQPSTGTPGTAPRTVDSSISMLLNAGNPDQSVPSTTNPSTFNPASQEVLAKSPENAAFRTAAQRAEERQRAQIAERDAATGRDASGGQEARFAGLRQSRGEQESQFLGQLAITKMQQAREDLVNGIQFSLANQQFDKAQALQKELALLNASIQEKQIASTAATAARQIGSNETLAGNSLAENRRQYDLGLGFNYTSLQQQANQAAANAALNGWG